jgi:UDP-GlcNAc:undecaprenyl-phosphate GlcNAc-1-phosphate transferase
METHQTSSLFTYDIYSDNLILMKMPLLYLLTFIVPATMTALSAPIWRQWCKNTGLYDEPGHRKIHSEPIALAGGLSVMTGIVITIAISYFALLIKFPDLTIAEQFHYGFGKRLNQLLVIICGSIAILVLGWLDDKHELKPAIKFGGQIIVALATALAGVRITLFVENQLFSYLVTVLWILTIVNAMNFLDNITPIAGFLSLDRRHSAQLQQFTNNTLWLLFAGLLQEPLLDSPI